MRVEGVECGVYDNGFGVHERGHADEVGYSDAHLVEIVGLSVQGVGFRV